ALPISHLDCDEHSSVSMRPIHTHTHTQTHTHPHPHKHTHTHTDTHPNTHTHTYSHTYTCSLMQSYNPINKQHKCSLHITHIPSIMYSNTHTDREQTHTHTHTHTHRKTKKERMIRIRIIIQHMMYGHSNDESIDFFYLSAQSSSY